MGQRNTIEEIGYAPLFGRTAALTTGGGESAAGTYTMRCMRIGRELQDGQKEGRRDADTIFPTALQILEKCLKVSESGEFFTVEDIGTAVL
jgi:hypothetical protein